MELGVDNVQRARHFRLMVARINTTAATALDSKAALAVPIPSNPMVQNTTTSIRAWDELDLSSWDQILRKGHSDSQLLVGDNVVSHDGGHCHIYIDRYNDGHHHRSGYY